MALKLQAESDPTVFRRQFTSALKELKTAKISLHEEVLMSVWLQALPRELSTLKQALGARSDLKWMDIYEALVGDYSSRMFSRAAGSNNRQPAESASVANETQHRDHRDHQQKKRKFSVRKVCSFCKKGTHSEDKCWSKHPHLRPNHNTRTRRSQEDTDDGVEHYMPFVDAEILNQFNEQQSEVVSESALASPEQLPNDNVPSLHFIFDSAATSHVVNSSIVFLQKGLCVEGDALIAASRHHSSVPSRHKEPAMIVAMIEGATALTRMPSLATSSASAAVSAATAALVAA